MGWQRTGYDYVPSPGEDYNPEGKPSEKEKPRVVVSGTDTDLAIDPNGNSVLLDKRGNRRTRD